MWQRVLGKISPTLTSARHPTSTGSTTFGASSGGNGGLTAAAVLYVNTAAAVRIRVRRESRRNSVLALLRTCRTLRAKTTRSIVDGETECAFATRNIFGILPVSCGEAGTHNEPQDAALLEFDCALT
eukprot:4244736-Prymnesium_polylepis.1